MYLGKFTSVSEIVHYEACTREYSNFSFDIRDEEWPLFKFLHLLFENEIPGHNDGSLMI